MDETVDEMNTGNLRNCCRVCLEEPHREQMLDMNLVFDVDAQLTFYDCYEICTKESLLQCKEHEPNSLCKHCGIELQWAYNFYRKVALSREQLKNMQMILDADIDSDDQGELEDKISDTEIVKDEIIMHSESSEQADQPANEPEPSALPSPPPESSQIIACDSVSDNVTRRRNYNGKLCCRYCNKMFRNHSILQKHMQIHLSDRPKFNCSFCNNSYVQKRSLIVHVNSKHKKVSNACSICGEAFSDASGLEVHKCSHNVNCPFQCNQCKRKFRSNRELDMHQRVWHRSSRFLCEFSNCGRFFTSLEALQNHVCSHTEMPFECNVCQQGFPARYKLQMHAQRKHNIQLTPKQLETMRKCPLKRSGRSLFKMESEQDENGSPNSI